MILTKDHLHSHPSEFDDQASRTQQSLNNDVNSPVSSIISLSLDDIETSRSQVQNPVLSANTQKQKSQLGNDSRDGIDLIRTAELLHALKKLLRLQKRALEAQIDARQKRRQAGFKRREVWVCDANFMKELQRLLAQEKMNGFESLLKMAGDCQEVRDRLGPLEEEGTKAEQLLEGKIWKLQQVEHSVNEEFEAEFRSSEDFDSGSSSVISSQYRSDSDSGEQPSKIEESNPTFLRISPSPLSDSMDSQSGENLQEPESFMSPNSVLFGLKSTSQVAPPSDWRDLEWDIDSGIEDLDELLEPTHKGQHHENFGGIDRYPKLSTEFATRRDRINKWLLNTTLLSRGEADLLKNILASENETMPSNWSELVIAYWEKDTAA